MFERFSSVAREVVARAEREAQLLQHPQVGTEHLLIALADPSPDAGAAAATLRDRGVTAERIRAALAARADRGSGLPGVSAADAEALRSLGIDVEQVRAGVERSLGAEALAGARPGARGFGRLRGGFVRFGPAARKSLELALREALRLRDDHIGTEHLLLGIIREGDGLGCTVLADSGIDPQELRRDLLGRLGRAA